MSGKSRIMIRGSGCSERRLGTAAGAEVDVQQRNEKWQAAVARSTFASQNAQNNSASEQFLKVRCRKMARRCCAKHIRKSKCTKHHIPGPIFEVTMPKNDTPLWREAHFQVTMHKTPQVFLKFSCRKKARRCGEKRICKSKCAKHLRFGSLRCGKGVRQKR